LTRSTAAAVKVIICGRGRCAVMKYPYSRVAFIKFFGRILFISHLSI
jgi:hypothetical protein